MNYFQGIHFTDHQDFCSSVEGVKTKTVTRELA